MNQNRDFDDEPCYIISIAARMLGVHEQTLRYYERVRLVVPSRSRGRHRLYSPREIERLRRVKTLTEEMGLNLAGAEVALKLMDRMAEMEQEIQRLHREVDRLRLQSRQEQQEE